MNTRSSRRATTRLKASKIDLVHLSEYGELKIARTRISSTFFQSHFSCLRHIWRQFAVESGSNSAQIDIFHGRGVNLRRESRLSLSKSGDGEEGGGCTRAQNGENFVHPSMRVFVAPRPAAPRRSRCVRANVRRGVDGFLARKAKRPRTNGQTIRWERQNVPRDGWMKTIIISFSSPIIIDTSTYYLPR